eukprot:1181445-Prorocentrum_minimum.AAC.4
MSCTAPPRDARMAWVRPPSAMSPRHTSTTVRVEASMRSCMSGVNLATVALRKVPFVRANSRSSWCVYLHDKHAR